MKKRPTRLSHLFGVITLFINQFHDKNFETYSTAFLGKPVWLPSVTPVPRSFEEQIFAATVESGDTVFDIGANTGENSVFLALLAGPDGIVLSFEPIWPTYRRLCETVQTDLFAKAAIYTFPFGVSDTDSVATMKVPTVSTPTLRSGASENGTRFSPEQVRRPSTAD